MIVPTYPHRLQLCTTTHPLLGDVFEASYLKMAKISKPADCIGLLPEALIYDSSKSSNTTPLRMLIYEFSKGVKDVDDGRAA